MILKGKIILKGEIKVDGILELDGQDGQEFKDITIDDKKYHNFVELSPVSGVRGYKTE